VRRFAAGDYDVKVRRAAGRDRPAVRAFNSMVDEIQPRTT
jgi:hypothetical protein